MTEWKDIYDAQGFWRKVRRMTDADIAPTIASMKLYLKHTADRADLPRYVQECVALVKTLVKALEKNGVPVNSDGEVPACFENGIICTHFGRVIFFDDVELVNRINMGEEVWPPVKY